MSLINSRPIMDIAKTSRQYQSLDHLSIIDNQLSRFPSKLDVDTPTYSGTFKPSGGSRSPSQLSSSSLEVYRITQSVDQVNSDQELFISSGEELVFPVRDGKADIVRLIKLTNLSEHVLTFKVIVLAPEKFQADPLYGILNPYASTNLKITFLKEFHYSIGRHRDKIIVQSAKLKDVPPMKIREFWRHLPLSSSMKNYIVHEQKIKLITNRPREFPLNPRFHYKTHRQLRDAFIDQGDGQELNESPLESENPDANLKKLDCDSYGKYPYKNDILSVRFYKDLAQNMVQGIKSRRFGLSLSFLILVSPITIFIFPFMIYKIESVFHK